jgi:hypothetical protein
VDPIQCFSVFEREKKNWQEKISSDENLIKRQKQNKIPSWRNRFFSFCTKEEVEGSSPGTASNPSEQKQGS